METRGGRGCGAVLCGVHVAAGTGRGVTEGQAPGASLGVIRGTVTIDDIPDAAMVEVTSDMATCGDEVEDRAEVVGASGGVANAVLIVTGAAWVVDPPAAVVNNKDCYFQPRVQVAKTRSLVSVRSEDEALHTRTPTTTGGGRCSISRSRSQGWSSSVPSDGLECGGSSATRTAGCVDGST